MGEPSIGRLIAFEGIDGAGKSTLASALVSCLRESGKSVTTVTRYMIPELTALWRRLVDADAVDQSAAAVITAADHWLGVQKYIQPALQAGAYVIADRSYYSHLIYFALRGIDSAHLNRLFSFALQPDLIVYLSISLDTAEARLARKGKPDFWEAGLDFHAGGTIGEAYRKYGQGTASRPLLLQSYRHTQRQALDLYPRVLPTERTLVLDAEQPVGELIRQTLASIQTMDPSCCPNG